MNQKRPVSKFLIAFALYGNQLHLSANAYASGLNEGYKSKRDADRIDWSWTDLETATEAASSYRLPST